ncbi:MAG: hypothetical protein CMP84_15450 [Gammaproteobacteria bacterium]|nr:hypothetical protein [Gammaproteobacteria bacterium]
MLSNQLFSVKSNQIKNESFSKTQGQTPIPNYGWKTVHRMPEFGSGDFILVQRYIGRETSKLAS